MLYLDAPGMKRLQIPTSPDAYKDFPTVRVESAGVAAGIEWSLAFLDCKQHPEGSVWITNYLNSTPKLDIDGGRLVNGRKTKGSFALVRSLHDVVDMGAYPPLFPLIERSKKTDADYKKRFEGNFRRLSDFSPFLLVSKASARLLSKSCDVDSYPTLSFRGNIIVDGEGLEPWAEESWAELEILSSSKAGDQNEPGMLLQTLLRHARDAQYPAGIRLLESTSSKTKSSSYGKFSKRSTLANLMTLNGVLGLELTWESTWGTMERRASLWLVIRSPRLRFGHGMHIYKMA
jgi:hypothetical protein